MAKVAKREAILIETGHTFEVVAAERFRASTEAAARVLDRKYRAYRGSLALTNADDSLKRRQALFKDYEELSGIDARRRIAGMFITS